MEQMTFMIDERSDAEILCEAIVKEINNSDYTRFLSVEEKSDGLISISAKSFLAARVKLTKKIMYLTAREKNLSYFDDYISSHQVEVFYIGKVGNDPWFRIPIKSLSDVLEMIEPICAVYMTVLADFGGERFGCCSRYEQCSNEKKCIHPDFIFSRACAYRENLEAGKIFYGKNRNQA